MSDSSDMSNDSKQNPFTRPGVLVSALVIGLLVVLGLTVVITNVARTSSDSMPSTSASDESATVAPSSSPSETVETDSVCGLPGIVLKGKVSVAPEAEWDYQGTMAYPASPKFGPGKTSAEGLRFCFQHSPEGAVFAAANAAVQGSDPTRNKPWIKYFLAKGPHRDALLKQGGEGGGSQGTRLELVGFRLLAYDGKTARVDVAVRGSAQGLSVYLSIVYNLVWEDGDWKLDVIDPQQPIDVARIPDPSGYVPWKGIRQ